jgi:hypothetical protein
LALLGGAGPGPGGQSARPQPPAADPLIRLNAEFRRDYARARAAMLAAAGPVIVVDGDRLVLRRGKERTAVEAVPAVYDRLKAVAHAPLAAYLLLAGGEQGFDDERLDDFRRLRDRTAAVARVLGEYGFSPTQLERQKKLLQETDAVLAAALQQRRFVAERRTAFARHMAPLVLANVTDAARAQIDGYQAQVTRWRRQMSAEEWARLRVVVIGSPMPRRANVAVQYFARLLGEAGEGKRIVYAESLDEARGLNLLGTHLLDRKIATDFFDDPRRMDRDLLGDAAAEYLRTLKLE